MHLSPGTGVRLLLATAVAGLGILATGPAALAKARIPEQPKVKSAAAKRVGETTPSRAQRGGTREIVSLGYDSYSGLEIYVVKVDGQVVGIPFG